MTSLYIEPTKFTPSIDFNVSSGILKIGGWSLPQNVENFYHPIKKWVDQFVALLKKEEHRRNIEMIIALTYYNSSSSRYLVEILNNLKKIKENGHDLKITWNIDKEDKQLKDSAREIADILEYPVIIKDL